MVIRPNESDWLSPELLEALRAAFRGNGHLDQVGIQLALNRFLRTRIGEHPAPREYELFQALCVRIPASIPERPLRLANEAAQPGEHSVALLDLAAAAIEQFGSSFGTHPYQRYLAQKCFIDTYPRDFQGSARIREETIS